MSSITDLSSLKNKVNSNSIYFYSDNLANAIQTIANYEVNSLILKFSKNILTEIETSKNEDIRIIRMNEDSTQIVIKSDMGDYYNDNNITKVKRPDVLKPGDTVIIPVLPGTVTVYLGNTDPSGNPTGTLTAVYYY